MPVKVYNNKIILNITEEGEIWIKGKKVNLDAIPGLMKVFKNEYPDGTVFITFEKDSMNKMAIKVVDEVSAAKVKMLVIATQR